MNDPTKPDVELLSIAESMLSTYKRVAYSSTDGVAQFNSPVYRAVKQALMVTLTALTGNRGRAFMVYSLWLDCGESIEYCYSIAAEANWRRAAFNISYENAI